MSWIWDVDFDKESIVSDVYIRYLRKTIDTDGARADPAMIAVFLAMQRQTTAHKKLKTPPDAY